jgi:hypothetical protein
MSEETKKDQPVEAGIPDLKSLLLKMKDAPTEDDLEQWKTEHGEINVSGFSEDEVYVWRCLTRREHLGLQQQAAQQQVDQMAVEELIVSQLVIWPVVADWQNVKSGTITTLHEQIMQQSNFASPAMASMMMAKL